MKNFKPFHNKLEQKSIDKTTGLDDISPKF